MITRHEPVRLRQKALKNGSFSLYLDIYTNETRSYEFLKLYLIPERTRADKDANRQTMILAETVRAQRLLEVQSGRFGLRPKVRKDASFTAYIEGQIATMSHHTALTWRTTLHALQRFRGKEDIRFRDLTPERLEEFASWMECEGLNPNTRKLYLAKVVACLHRAAKDGYVSRDAVDAVPHIKGKETARQFLTLDELHTLTATRCISPSVRRAFLFSCLTGLRISDIRALLWSEVQTYGGRTRIVFSQQKTDNLEYYDINEQAADLLGERGEGLVFADLPSDRTVTNALVKWVGEAGISKHITFHSARHTFAVMMLDLGVDIFTVSKLLGHRDIKTTQIYAKVLDKNKQAAVDRIPALVR